MRTLYLFAYYIFLALSCCHRALNPSSGSIPGRFRTLLVKTIRASRSSFFDFSLLSLHSLTTSVTLYRCPYNLVEVSLPSMLTCYAPNVQLGPTLIFGNIQGSAQCRTDHELNYSFFFLFAVAFSPSVQLYLESSSTLLTPVVYILIYNLDC